MFLGDHEPEAETGDEVAVCLQYRGVLFAALKQTAQTLSFQTTGPRPASEPALGVGKAAAGKMEDGNEAPGRMILFWHCLFLILIGPLFAQRRMLLRLRICWT